MDQKVFEHVKKFCEAKGYGSDEETVVEVIRETTPVWKDSGDKHRWYILYRKVVVIDGMCIGFLDAECTGDDGTEDSCPFNKKSIREYVAKEKVVTVYEPKPEDAPQKSAEAVVNSI